MSQHEIYRQAIYRRDALQAELAEIAQFISLFEKLFGPDPDQVLGARDAVNSISPDDREIRKRNNPKIIADLAEKALVSSNRPMQRGELVDAIERMGVPIQSDDKPRYIGTILWRNLDRFENIEGRGYWLKGRHLPEVQSLFE